jgi:peroxiredoxin
MTKRRHLDRDAIDADAIDRTFVPHAQADVAMVHVGSEVVLGRVGDDGPYLQTCALNESGAIVWQCFDGSGTIDEIAVDIADVFGVDIAAVRLDIESLARDVGNAGFLVGVREGRFEIGSELGADGAELGADGAELDGIAVGQPLPVFTAEAENGEAFSASQLRGRRALVVSWSPTCSFCALIGDELAALAPSLDEAGVDLVLLASGEARANRASLDRHGLTGRLLLLNDDDGAEGFAGLGTPVAYLVDELGVVAEPLALGATEVVELARLARG